MTDCNPLLRFGYTIDGLRENVESTHTAQSKGCGVLPNPSVIPRYDYSLANSHLGLIIVTSLYESRPMRGLEKRLSYVRTSRPQAHDSSVHVSAHWWSFDLRACPSAILEQDSVYGTVGTVPLTRLMGILDPSSKLVPDYGRGGLWEGGRCARSKKR